jgi:hypothetical protein
MKMQIVGFDGAVGVGAKSGKDYDMGNVYILAELAPSFSPTGIAKGSMGTSYPAPFALISKIAHLPTPFVAEVDIQPVMRFGKREEHVKNISPIQTTTKVIA